MKGIRKFCKLMIVLITITVVSCNKNKKIDAETNTENIDLNQIDSSAKVEFLDEETQEIYNLYLTIKDALVNSDSETVQAESKKLEAVIDPSKEKEQLKATLKLISLTKDIAKQRDFFVTLTSEVEKLINKTEIKSGVVYMQFCPMAFDGEGGYWLSDSKEIRNPYFGNKMLKCGSIKNILK
ncbi:DUF3347 domain-containing protein [Aquimarina sp. 2304DJ70-9]|uniref:DUF3347 domain-containing protein n=1 Tax=Aquimarina penaris TaxID=3231044 RepID=UPI00346188F9